MKHTYFSQSFSKVGRKFKTNGPSKEKSEEAAIKSAVDLASRKDGAVAYSVAYDDDVDFYDEPNIIYRSGELPPEFDNS